jgi:hypothetical protein
VTNTAVRDLLIGAVKNWVSDGQNNGMSPHNADGGFLV